MVADTAGKSFYLEDVSSNFVYEAFDRWAARVEAWRDGGQRNDAVLTAPRLSPKAQKCRDFSVYFGNDVKVCAPFDAMNLAARLGHGGLVPFPRKARRAVEAVRGVEEPLSSWDRWKFDPAKKRTA